MAEKLENGREQLRGNIFLDRHEKVNRALLKTRKINGAGV